MKKIYRIVLGWWYWITNTNNEEAQERLLICSQCPFMKLGVCKKCGCALQAKARIHEESCPDKKWKHVHHWESRYSTGTYNSVWKSNGKTGTGKSFVFECSCGAWAVRHSGDSEYNIIK